jgi:hypothetical protein
MPVDYNKTPFPWFGGKSAAAEAVWAALGDPAHYVEPFAGSLAALLRRPALANRAYYSETVNDLDGLLVNAWRSIALSPAETAEAASWPVSECDLHARHLALLRWKDGGAVPLLMGDPTYHDPVMAGWWLWGQSSWIGSGWCSGQGPWVVDDDGAFVKRPKTTEAGVWKQRPHLSDDGRGVNHPRTREAGVSRQRPHLSNDGRGVNRPQIREAGVGDFHEMTMPELLRWFEYLSARLRHVRILCGSWTRACTSGAIKSLSVRSGKGYAGVFLDPPYVVTDNRAADLYSHDDGDNVAVAVREWCAANGDDPAYRIVLAGFDGEHDSLCDIGWTAVEWFKSGYLTGGMGNTSKAGAHQQKKERLWLSPHCASAVEPEQEPQINLFGRS